MNISSATNQAQEALETVAQTRTEAAQGDVQAKLRLAQSAKLQMHVPTQAASTPTASAPAGDAHTDATPSVPPPPTGAVINSKA